MPNARKPPLISGKSRRGRVIIVSAVLLSLIVLLIEGQAALSQLPPAERAREIESCRSRPDSLVGIETAALIERCGYWDDSSRLTTASTTREQVIYGNVRRGERLMFVYIEDGVVTAVQTY